MRYSTEPKYRKYVKGYGFLSYARRFGDKYCKKLMDTATKTGAAETASKWVVQKTEETTGDFIRNKITDKITLLGETKSKEKEDGRPEIYIPPEKNTADFWWLEIVLIPYKNGIPKSHKLIRYNTWWSTQIYY